MFNNVQHLFLTALEPYDIYTYTKKQLLFEFLFSEKMDEFEFKVSFIFY